MGLIGELRLLQVLAVSLVILHRFGAVQAEYTPENSIQSIPESLKECYRGDTYAKWNLLPQNIETLIAIIRKIEENREMTYQTLRQLTPGILHRFRQDGIVRDPHIQRVKEGVVPYSPHGDQFYRHSQLLRMIPQNSFQFPNDTISAVERCSLHHMLSSSIDIYERDNVRAECRGSYAYGRYKRNADKIRKRGVKDEVEVLSPKQLKLLQDDQKPDPSSFYPTYPDKDRPTRNSELPPLSQCPPENGVIKTKWGTVSAGSVLAGIASSLEPQSIRIVTFLSRTRAQQPILNYPSNMMIETTMFATLAGDLAEVALIQGARNSDYNVGIEGSWNSSDQPLFYRLYDNDNLQLTAAEILGGLDGLVLSNFVPTYNSKYNNLKLSQVLDMYYSRRGLFDPEIKACKRSKFRDTLATKEKLATQAHSAAILLANSGLATVGLSSENIEEFASEATTKLVNSMRTMNDNDCSPDEANYYESLPAVDVTIILDTDWPYEEISRVLWQLLQNLDINKYNSNFTLMNGADGSFIINSTWSHLDLYNLTRLRYEQLRVSGAFNLERTIDKLERYQRQKLNRERDIKWAGGKSEVILIAPYSKNPQPDQREYLHDRFMSMRESVPDAEILFLTSNSNDGWSYFVLDPETDVIKYFPNDPRVSNPRIDSLQARIKQVPRRLINTQCGADYRSRDRSIQLTEYIGPKGRNFYRIHPNYFFTRSDSRPKIKIQMIRNSIQLKVCTARELMHPNLTEVNSKNCPELTSNGYEIQLDCGDATYIHDCRPVYIYVESNAGNSSNSYQTTCTDSTKCRFLNDVSYTITFENLVCTSGQSMLLATPILLLLILSRFIL